MVQLVFYVFATILVGSAAMVISARNPVHSVLFLILAFFNAAGLFLVAGAEFLAMILVIVYVGAVAVLFLFVVMMLDIDFTKMREGLQRYAPIGAVVGCILFVELAMAGLHWGMSPVMPAPITGGLGLPGGAATNTGALGNLIYTHYILLFQLCGIVLLVAMIGAITLTLRDRPMGRRQIIARQHERKRADTLEMMTLPLGQGTDANGGFIRPNDSYYVTAVPGSYGVPAAETREPGEGDAE
ncbi:NADH-quinone oxidoreductase subunit J [Acetobacter sp.]|jgi:NADH-quinone oxidoreductase subunit J|uniref:NADH-quinone oxidoreductase subunit J n=1 Tax=Acetobacter sp. TaxID=440 RepID=UPI0025C60A27|nr:NADH-quinone oxidoreductase subunit J [Acetobacter sp.]MCH4091257.1 NADH-quinone oxidoreductase subunit J [Acetobacter sp.]MCI1300848.1 NADH-quinone oxidoreductase subunit J [Acetobacter sp.]MCI1317176.1 NADH-quinone oxidoreductase subunit J [Acetobacter sp.]